MDNLKKYVWFGHNCSSNIVLKKACEPLTLLDNQILLQVYFQ